MGIKESRDWVDAQVITRVIMDVDDSGLLPDDTVDKEVGTDDVVDIGSMSE